jgi:sugar-specific transcriptional regulator TrmB
MAETELVRALESLGMNLNEARAYGSLLVRGASTGYEVAQHSGIPRSAVYAVLRKLVTEGAARKSPGPPERFTATPAEALVAQWRKRLDTSAAGLLGAVARLDVAGAAPDAHSVQGYDRILEEATSLVHSAERTLVVSGWPRELALLQAELVRAERRGVTVVVFSHAALPPTLPGILFSYGLGEAALEAFWKHRLVVVADDRKSLLGAVERTSDDRAVVSDTVAIAEIAVSQVALDITLLSQRHGHDAGPVLATILGDRIGRLDTVPTKGASVLLGTRAKAPRAASTKPKRSR